LALLALALAGAPAVAQVTDVVVGITPSCPYGLSACWGGAYEALSRLKGVASVARTPNAEDCTARVQLKERRLPDPEAWSKQFKARVGNVYEFRGIEVTLKGTVREKDGRLVLTAPGLPGPVTLARLRTKIQWNFKKKAARQPEPDERDAYEQLAAEGKKKAGGFGAQVTGPLRTTDQGPVLEVREFVPAEAGGGPAPAPGSANSGPRRGGRVLQSL
jgi:hypothetical protein